MTDQHRHPQLGDAVLLTDGGIETTLIGDDGLELPGTVRTGTRV